MNLSDYARMVKRARCRCGAKLPTADIRYYPHDGGWDVEGFEGKQWLYVECPSCGYQWALWKLLKG